jgi:hypothetical protein
MEGLDQEMNPIATELEQSNALALAIISPGLKSQFFLYVHIAFF